MTLVGLHMGSHCHVQWNSTEQNLQPQCVFIMVTLPSVFILTTSLQPKQGLLESQLAKPLRFNSWGFCLKIFLQTFYLSLQNVRFLQCHCKIICLNFRFPIRKLKLIMSSSSTDLTNFIRFFKMPLFDTFKFD